MGACVERAARLDPEARCLVSQRRTRRQMVVVRTLGGGEIAFVDNHAPFLGALATGPARVKFDDGTQVWFAVHGGFVEVGNNHVIILSDVAELHTQIDVDRAQAAPRPAPKRRCASTPTTPTRSPRCNAQRHASASWVCPCNFGRAGGRTDELRARHRRSLRAPDADAVGHGARPHDAETGVVDDRHARGRIVG